MSRRLACRCYCFACGLWLISSQGVGLGVVSGVFCSRRCWAYCWRADCFRARHDRGGRLYGADELYATDHSAEFADLVDTWASASQLQRCDIVAFSYGEQRVMIKRLVALPGDRVEIAGNAARINGRESACVGPMDAVPSLNVPTKTRQLASDEFCAGR